MTIELQLKCAQRELAKRKAVYPKLIADGKLSEDRAATEIDTMAAIVKTLETQAFLEAVSREIAPGTRALQITSNDGEPLLI